MIRVAVVDDHPLFLDGVMQTLRGAPDIDVVGAGASAADAIRIGVEFVPDVMVLDMSMPGITDGIAAVAALKAAAPTVRTLVLTVVADGDRVIEAIRKGASGYVLKGIGGDELIRIVRAVHAGETYLAPVLAARLVARLGGPSTPTESAGLTPTQLGVRERQILSLIAKGLSNKEIALRLELSDKTVKHYVTGLLHKLQVRNRTAAAVVAPQWLPWQQSDLHPG